VAGAAGDRHGDDAGGTRGDSSSGGNNGRGQDLCHVIAPYFHFGYWH